MSGRITRWVLLLQEYNYEVIVQAGKHHENTDFLSRLQGPEPSAPLSDEFPDDQLWHLEDEDSQYFHIV